MVCTVLSCMMMTMTYAKWAKNRRVQPSTAETVTHHDATSDEQTLLLCYSQIAFCSAEVSVYVVKVGRLPQF